MKLKKLIYLLLLASFMSNSSTLVMLKGGQNNIDLNNNGITDIIFLASFDNNTSHPNRTATIFMKDNKKWSIIPTPDDNGFIWSDFSLSASMVKISDFELHQYKNHYYMVKGKKFIDNNNSGDLSDNTQIKFIRYKIANNEVDPGVSNLYWQPTGSYITIEKYLNVDDAFKFLDMALFK